MYPRNVKAARFSSGLGEGQSVKRAAYFLAHEFRRGLSVFAFFFVAFHMIALTKAVSVSGFSITWFSASVATIGALIIAKTVLLADNSRLANVFSQYGIAGILWKTLLFAVIATIFRLIEEGIHASVAHGGLRTGINAIASAFSEPYFVVVELWLLLLLFLFCLLTRQNSQSKPQD